MIEVLFTEDDSICSTENYVQEPEKYRGNIVCIECREKAWFIKGFDTERLSRMACFGAHHVEGCDASTVQLVSDDTESEDGEKDDGQTSDIYIDLDRSKSQSIYVSEDNDKHGEESSERQSAFKKKTIGNAGGFPLNKSLRQLLTNLCNNREYLEQEREIKVVTDSGRVILQGELKDKAIHFSEITQNYSQNSWLFWGTINNTYLRKNGELWLNSGNSKEPSVIVNKTLVTDLKNNFKIKDLSELNGSDILVIGPLGFDGEQALIRPAFTKYMTFRRHKVQSDSNS